MFGMPLTRHLLSKLSVYVSTALLRYPVQAHYCKSSAVRSLVQRAVLYAYVWLLAAPRAGEVRRTREISSRLEARGMPYFRGNFRNPKIARNTLFPKEFPELCAQGNLWGAAARR